MKGIRTTSILAGLLLGIASVSVTACQKKDDDKTAKGKKGKKGNDKDKDKIKAGKTVDKAKDPAKDKPPVADKTKPAEPAAGGAQKLVFNRKLTVGYKYRLTSTGKGVRNVTANGKPAENVAFSWDYEAEVEVKELSPRGMATKEEHKVVKLEVTVNGKKATPIEKGKVIIGTVQADDEKFEIDGKPITEKMLEEVVSSIFELDDNDMDRDEVFGSKDPRKPGDTWEPNAAAMVKSFSKKLADSPMPAKAENIKGTVKFVEAKPMEGVPAVAISVDVKIKDVAPKMGPVKPTAGTLTVTMQHWMPADIKLAAPSGSTNKMVMHVEGDVAGPGGQNAKIVADVTQEETKKRIPLK